MIDELEKELNQNLTRTQAEILYHICKGKTNQQIQTELNMPQSSFQLELKKVLDKLNIPKSDPGNPNERREYFIQHFCGPLNRLVSLSDNFKTWPLPVQMLDVPEHKAEVLEAAEHQAKTEDRGRSTFSPLIIGGGAIIFLILIAVIALFLINRQRSGSPVAVVPTGTQPVLFTPLAASNTPLSASNPPSPTLEASSSSTEVPPGVIFPTSTTNIPSTTSVATPTLNVPPTSDDSSLLATIQAMAAILSSTPIPSPTVVTTTPEPPTTPTETLTSMPTLQANFTCDFSDGPCGLQRIIGDPQFINGHLSTTRYVWYALPKPDVPNYRIEIDADIPAGGDSSTPQLETQLAVRYMDQNNYVAYCLGQTGEWWRDVGMSDGWRIAGTFTQGIPGRHIWTVEVAGDKYTTYRDDNKLSDYITDRYPEGGLAFSVRSGIVVYRVSIYDLP